MLQHGMRWTPLLFAIATLIPCSFVRADTATTALPFLRGADLSSLPAVEAAGGVFTDSGAPGEAMAILQARGMNAVRLRLWHTPNPSYGHGDLSSTLAMAARAESLGLAILLDLHYSDDWADPGKQTKPAAWSALGFAALRDSVRAYTQSVLLAMSAQGTLPAIVQIGNEITPGMLWDDGRVSGAFDTPAQWTKLAQLIESARLGIGDALGPGDSVAVMIHIDRGGDNGGARRFFDHLIAEGVSFDYLGLSYYPWWHGTPIDFRDNLTDLAARYQKPVVIAELAYPWTLGWADNTFNPVGDPSHLHICYDATPARQYEYLRDMIDIMTGVPNGAVEGWFYWEPAWLPGETFGSPWENVGLFDFDGEVLRGADAFSAP
ncbi:MAG: antitoxin [Gemmatimonadetes bacterium]|nr:antitoxin [Gemmatimonadota bacterium]